MRSLGEPNAAWAGDRGEADPAIRAAVATAGSGRPEDYLAAVAALCTARLLLPVVADGDETGLGDPDRHAEMSAVTMTSAAGERGVLAFTGLDGLQAFDPAARPVPCTLDTVAATARDLGAVAIVIDVAGPYQFVLDDTVIAPLASGNRLVALEDGWGWLSITNNVEDHPPS